MPLTPAQVLERQINDLLVRTQFDFNIQKFPQPIIDEVLTEFATAGWRIEVTACEGQPSQYSFKPA